MFVAAESTGGGSTNCFDKSRRQYVVKALSFSVIGTRTRRGERRRRRQERREERKEGRQIGRKEGRKNPRRSARRGVWSEPRKRGRRGLSKFRLNSPRINIRNGAPGCHKLACCPLLSFSDSIICTARPVTVRRKLRLFRVAVLRVDITEA